MPIGAMNSDIRGFSVVACKLPSRMFTTWGSRVFPPAASVARAERLHLAHPHDEGTVLRAGLCRLEEAHALGNEGSELEGRAVEIAPRLKRRDRLPAAAPVRRVQLDPPRRHVAVAVEAPEDVDGRHALRLLELKLDPVRLR